MRTKELALLAAGAAMAARRSHVYETRNITVNRAPTDESVRLLKEMEEKAQAKVDAAVHIENNAFNCVVHSWYDGFNDINILRAVFDLNGTRMTVQVSKSCLSLDDKVALAGQLRDAIAKEIANSALDHIGAALERKI
jgi:hypothetical protein